MTTEQTEKPEAAAEMPSEAPVVQAPVPVLTPGQILQRAREAKRRTIGELANQTRLSKVLLEALERDDFVTLSKPVFVRGYLRKCAQVLGLNDEELIRSYAQYSGTPVDPKPLPVIISEPPRQYDEPSRGSGLKYIIALGVLIGVGLWWFGSSGGDGAHPVNTNQAVAAPDGTRTLEVEPPVSNASTVQPQPQAQMEGAPSQTPTQIQAPAPAAPAKSSEPEAPAAAGPATLQIQVSNPSWVEISDENGKRLVYDLLRPGDRREVSGKPPYQVVLGNPAGIHLAMGGREVDLSPYTSSTGTARFTLQ